MNKPYSEACEQNKEPILKVLAEVFTEPSTVLEIGSGTGQHAVFFPRMLPYLIWQPTDVSQYLSGINAWIKEAGLGNVKNPLVLDVSDHGWPVERVEYVFSANTVHIMSWSEVEYMFQGIGKVLVTGGSFCLYGPFNYNGSYTSESNARFDDWLKARDPNSGIRDYEALEQLARKAGMIIVRDYEMPANNRTLVWQKT